MALRKFKNNFYVGRKILSLSDLQFLPRWIVLVMDIGILFFSLILSYFIILNLNVSPPAHWSLFFKFLFIIGIHVLFMLIFKTYVGVIRHSTFVDLIKLLVATFCTICLLILFNYSYYYGIGYKIFLTPLFIIYGVISFCLLFFFRLSVKEAFHLWQGLRNKRRYTRILVLGTSESSVAMASAVINNPNNLYDVQGFLTDRADLKRARLLGRKIITKEVLATDKFENLDIEGVLIIPDTLSREELNSWVNYLLESDLKIFKAPPLQEFGDRDIGASIKKLQIEDLLNRKPISIKNNAVGASHENKTILVTGGAGSIGSEIVRQVAGSNPKTVVVLDQAETPLHEIELELLQNFPDVHFEFILADISNLGRIKPIFETYAIDKIYHAAAYKHVPLIEKNPHEAILVNILGTKNIASLASAFQVKDFIMISTDKAVNPTNIMGASKRVAELYVQALQEKEDNKTKFITTRFGNVLGSNGSVIPYFKKQIEAGGPLTVTHKEITRYFMTIPEACELVLQAGTMGQGGEIFVFDMGEPVKIVDLARRMIRLSGYVPDVDIKIVFSGLRPGEKLYEELLSDGTKTLPTHHHSIMISKDPCVDFEEIAKLVHAIVKSALRRDQMEIVQLLKEIVPEFKSQNSVFQKLDKVQTPL